MGAIPKNCHPCYPPLWVRFRTKFLKHDQPTARSDAKVRTEACCLFIPARDMDSCVEVVRKRGKGRAKGAARGNDDPSS